MGSDVMLCSLKHMINFLDGAQTSRPSELLGLRDGGRAILEKED